MGIGSERVWLTPVSSPLPSPLFLLHFNPLCLCRESFRDLSQRSHVSVEQNMAPPFARAQGFWFLSKLLSVFYVRQEFVFFFLPLVNIHKLKNMIVRRFSSPATRDKQPSIKVACHECGICSEPPTAPHQGQCGHVFCYYCVKVIEPIYPGDLVT